VELRKPARRRANVPAPVELPVGQLLPSIQGYFAYFYEEGGSPKRTIVSGAWWDPRSNAGEESLLRIQSVLADAFCGQREVPLTDVAYLGREYTRDMEALNTAWLGPLSAPPILSGHDVKFTRTPAGATFMRYYPVRALARNLEGASTLLCDVTVALALSCTLVRAKPEGFGFGEAAVQIAHTAFTVDPVLRDGSPAAGRKMCLNIGFALMD
jgi:hypothetical protein